MLEKNKRLSRFKEFEAVFKNSYSNYNQLFGFKSAKNASERVRFGMIVSAKVSKQAVKRNQIKRRLRYLAQKFLPELRLGFDIIIIALPESAAANYAQTEAAFILGLKKLRLFKANGN
jgi:ribonuclease P protein component